MSLLVLTLTGMPHWPINIKDRIRKYGSRCSIFILRSFPFLTSCFLSSFPSLYLYVIVELHFRETIYITKNILIQTLTFYTSNSPAVQGLHWITESAHVPASSNLCASGLLGETQTARYPAVRDIVFVSRLWPTWHLLCSWIKDMSLTYDLSTIRVVTHQLCKPLLMRHFLFMKPLNQVVL